MNNPSESKSFQEQISAQMEERETEDLIAIWQENDRTAWTDDAFRAIEAVLIQRLGQLPERKSPESEPETESPQVKYPADKKLIWIADFSNRLSWVILAVFVVNFIIKLIDLLSMFSLQMTGNQFLGDLIFVADQVDKLILAGFMFLVLQAITEIIYLLMDTRDLVQPEAIDLDDSEKAS